jgi:tetratricopeptide (TPR) repeat protein
MVDLPEIHPMRAALASGVGSLERDLDRCAQALPHFERAIAIFDHMGRGGIELAVQLTNRGACLLYTDRFAEAKQSLARAETMYIEQKVEPAQFSELWLLQAELADALGQRRDAIVLTKKMLASTRDSDGAMVASLRAYARQMLAKWRA